MFFIHTDHLSTPRAITSQSGVFVWKWDNTDPFGKNLPTNSGFDFNLRFMGQYFDSETGLFYNYYRYYNPETGRYMQSDPIGLKGGVDTYSYVEQNPLKSVDPLGLCSCGDPNDLIRNARADKRNWTTQADRSDINRGFGSGENKCNLFVDTQYEESGYSFPNTGGKWYSKLLHLYPAGAKDLSRPDYDLPGWTVVKGEPQPGDLIAYSGHVAIDGGVERLFQLLIQKEILTVL